jgi:hypothetical protein
LQLEFAAHGALGGEQAGQKLPKLYAVSGRHKQGKPPAHQALAHGAQQLAPAQVELLNQARGREGIVAHGGKVVQVEVLRPGALHLGLGQEQLLVLHFQLNLVHLQLLHQPLQLLGRLVLGGFRNEVTPLFGAGPQGQQGSVQVGRRTAGVVFVQFQTGGRGTSHHGRGHG